MDKTSVNQQSFIKLDFKKGLNKRGISRDKTFKANVKSICDPSKSD